MAVERRAVGHYTMPTVKQEISEEQRAIKERRRRRVQLAILALLLLSTTTLGWAVSLFQTGRVGGLEDTTASVALTGLGSAIRTNTPFVLYGVAFLIVMSNLSRLKWRSMRGLVPSLFGVVLLYIANATTTQNITATFTFLALIALIAVTVWSIGLELEDLVVLGRIGFGIAAISLFMAATTDMAWTDAGAESKGLLTDATLAGFFPQMNPLGMSLAITLPFVFLFKRPSVRLLGFVTIALTLVLASSRTALIAAGVGLLVGFVLRIVPPATRIFWGWVATIMIVAVSILVPVTAERGAFTGRGDIWQASLTLIPQSPIWGHGPIAFAKGGAVTHLVGVAHWHGHNMWITFMVIGGVVALIALILFWVPALRNSFRIARDGNLVPVMAVLAALSLGIAEVQIRPSEFDGVAWVSWLVLFAIATLVKKPQDAAQEEESCQS